MSEVSVDGIDVFVLSGEFDAYSMPMLGDQLEGAIRRGEHELVIDMAEVTFVDMSTLNRIVQAMKQVYRRNGHLVVASEQRHVLRAIELAGLRHSVKVYATRDEAVAALRRAVRRPGS